jgi:CxxC-x17-CxxC domain-containing protein
MKKFYHRGGGGGWKGDRGFGHKPSQKFEATCSACGAECEVPFRPTGERPVFCNFCFKKEDQGNRPPKRFGGGRSSFGDKPMFPAQCDACGNECQVPFRPTGEKPVYCSDCFGQQAPSGRKGGSKEKHGGSDFQKELKEIHTKLDAILAVLRPEVIVKTEKKEKVAEGKKEIEEAKKEEAPSKKETGKKVTKKKAVSKKKK